MKISVNKEDLLKALIIVSRAISSNSIIPSLSYIHIVAKDSNLFFEATDLELTIKYSIKADFEDSISFLIPSAIFINYLKFNNDDEITIEVCNDFKINIYSDKSETFFKYINDKDFPKNPDFKKCNYFKIKTKELLSSLNQTYFSISRDSARTNLLGLGVTIDGKKITFASTDSFRLSERFLELDGDPLQVSFMIPYNAIMELIFMSNNFNEEYVSFSVDDNQIQVQFGLIFVYSRLLKNTLPNYKAIIRQKSSITALVKKTELANSIKRVGLFSSEHNTLILKFNNDLLSISSGESQSGSDEINIKSRKTGDNCSISLSYIYLQDVLKSLPFDDVKIEIENSMSPCIITQDELLDYKHIIMPFMS